MLIWPRHTSPILGYRIALSVWLQCFPGGGEGGPCGQGQGGKAAGVPCRPRAGAVSGAPGKSRRRPPAGRTQRGVCPASLGPPPSRRSRRSPHWVVVAERLSIFSHLLRCNPGKKPRRDWQHKQDDDFMPTPCLLPISTHHKFTTHQHQPSPSNRRAAAVVENASLPGRVVLFFSGPSICTALYYTGLSSVPKSCPPQQFSFGNCVTSTKFVPSSRSYPCIRDHPFYTEHTSIFRSIYRPSPPAYPPT